MNEASYVPDAVKPVFKDTEHYDVIPFRDFLRENFPVASKGFVVEDVDLLIRGYGASYQTDGTGVFMLVECKYGRAWPNFAQLMTFGLMDRLLRQGDPERKRYMGYYVVQFSDGDWNVAEFRVNGQPLSRENFLRFLDLKLDLPPYSFPVMPVN